MVLCIRIFKGSHNYNLLNKEKFKLEVNCKKYQSKLKININTRGVARHRMNQSI